MLLSEEEKKKLAKLVNARVDIPLVPEEMEATIFEYAVGAVDVALEDVLPQAFGNLMRDGETGIDPERAKAFGERLVTALNQKINLPYLSEEQEANFLQVAVAPLVKAMSDGETLEGVLATVKEEVGERLEGLDASD